jgi:hypothetical protein
MGDEGVPEAVEVGMSWSGWRYSRDRHTLPCVTRRLATCGCALLVFFISRGRLESQENCEKDVHLIFQAEPSGSSARLFFGAVSEVAITMARGSPAARHAIAAAIVSDVGGGVGVQGWTLAMGLDGELTLTGASVDALNPALVCPTAFQAVHIVDPQQNGADGRPQGQGVIAAVVFFCGRPTTLPPHGTESVLAMTLEAEVPPQGEEVRGTLRCRDGLVAPGADAASAAVNLATIDGESFPFCSCGSVTVRFQAADPARFRRCDADDSGRLDLEDAVALLVWLFRRGPAPPCQPVADCNADGALNVADAVYALRHLFGGGPPPPPPFPECGPAQQAPEVCAVEPKACRR